MFFIPIIAGWTLGLTSAKLIDSRPRTMVQIASFYAPARKIDGPSTNCLQESSESEKGPLFQEKSPSFVASTTEFVKRPFKMVQKFKEEKIDKFHEDMRIQYMKEISLDEEVISEEQKFAEQHFKFSSAFLVSTATCALLYPPLVFFHIPPMIYLEIPLYKQAYQELKERGVTTSVVDATLSISSIGYTFRSPPILVMGAIAGWVYAYTEKLVAQSKDGTRKKLTNLFGQQPNYVWVVQDAMELLSATSSFAGCKCFS